jgi:hypothetical protein
MTIDSFFDPCNIFRSVAFINCSCLPVSNYFTLNEHKRESENVKIKVFCPFVLRGWRTSSLALRHEQYLRICENRLLGRTFVFRQRK